MELSLARNVKDDKKGFCKYIADKRKCVPTAEGDAGPGYTGHVRGCVLNTFFASVFVTKSQPSGIPGPRDQAERLNRVRCTFGGRGLGQGILK